MTQAPILLLDLDGVLDPFAAPVCPDGYLEHEFFAGEALDRYCVAHGDAGERDRPGGTASRDRALAETRLNRSFWP